MGSAEVQHGVEDEGCPLIWESQFLAANIPRFSTDKG